MNDKQKALTALFLVMLAVPALAAVTVTINSPASGTTYNNLPANLRTIDLNFTVADNNANVRDLNLNIIYYSTNTAIKDGTDSNWTVIVSDVNIFDINVTPTATQKCHGTNWTSFTCSIRWALPAHTTLGEGEWAIDVNVADVTLGPDWPAGAEEINADANATVLININNHLTGAQAIRNLMALVGVVLGGIVLVGGLAMGILTKADPAKTAIMTIVTAIAVAIGSVIIGVVLSTL